MHYAPGIQNIQVLAFVGTHTCTARRSDGCPDSLSIGQVDPSGEGSYARRADEAQSWLLDAVVEVPVDPVAWLEPGIKDIPSSDIAQVVIRHADGEVVRLDRAGEEGGEGSPAFVLRDVPEGRAAGGEREEMGSRLVSCIPHPGPEEMGSRLVSCIPHPGRPSAWNKTR